MRAEDKVLVLLDDLSRYLREVPGGIILTEEQLARMGLRITPDHQRMTTTLDNPNARIVLKGDFLISAEDDDPTAPELHRLGGEPPEYSGIWTTPDPIEPRIM